MLGGGFATAGDANAVDLAQHRLRQNLVTRTGTGRANDPFKFWLPSRMPVWLADPLWCLLHGMPQPDPGGETPPPAVPGDTDATAADWERHARKESSAAPAEPVPADPPVPSPEEGPRPTGRIEETPAPAPPSHEESVRRWLASLQQKG